MSIIIYRDRSSADKKMFITNVSKPGFYYVILFNNTEVHFNKNLLKLSTFIIVQLQGVTCQRMERSIEGGKCGEGGVTKYILKKRSLELVWTERNVTFLSCNKTLTLTHILENGINSYYLQTTRYHRCIKEFPSPNVLLSCQTPWASPKTKLVNSYTGSL